MDVEDVVTEARAATRTPKPEMVTPKLKALKTRV